MSPDKLINQLETLGSIDRKIISKLREQVKAAKTPPKAMSILKYLVKKDLLSEADARKILKSDAAKKPAKHNDSDLQTRVAEPHELEIHEHEKLEVAEIENSLSEVIDPNDLKLERAPRQKKQVNTDYFGDTASSPSTASARNRDSDEGSSALGAFRKNDQKNQWNSKWPFIGIGSVVLLSMVGLFLAFWLAGASADQQYDAALKSFQNSTYEDAVKKFDEFIKVNPSHVNINQAKSRRVNAVMRSKFASKQWVETIKAGEQLLPPLAEEPDNDLSSIREDVGFMLVESLYHESEKAVDLKELPQMETADTTLSGFWKFIDNPLYLPTSTRKGERVSKLIAATENNRSTVTGLIDKEKSYTSTIADIREKGAAKQTDEAFRSYIDLTRDYPDLAARKELRETMKEISDAEQSLVVPIQEKIAVTTEPSQEAARSISLAATTGKPVNTLRGEALSVLVDGAVYAFNASSGAVLWRKFVGLQTQYQPQKFDVDSLIVSDLLRNEVIRVRSDSGELVWRASIGEPFQEPNFNETQVVVTTKSGKIVLLDGQTGEMVGGAKLPQATNTGALLASRLPILYQTGSYSNLYVISTSSFDCKSVMYLGHSRNSIAVPPISWSGYLVIVRNGGDFADLIVLKPDETGMNLTRTQTIKRITDAPITTPIQYFGRGLLLFADNGDMRVLELNPGNETSPVSVRAKKRFETEGQRAYAAFQGTKLWAAGKGLRRYKVQRNLGQFKDEEVVEPGDTFLAAPKVLDDKLFHVRRRLGSSMVSASMVDALSLEPVWRTDFGGSVAGIVGDGNAIQAVSNQGDIFKIDGDALQSQVALSPIIASEVIENLSFSKLLLSGDNLVSVSADDTGRSNDLLSYKMGSEQSRLARMGIEQGDIVVHDPVLLGKDLVVATKQGQIAKLDVESGQLKGSPFLPPVSPGITVPWLPLLKINADTLVAGHSSVTTGTGVTPSKMFFLTTKNPASVEKKAELDLEGSLSSQMTLVDSNVYAVMTGDGADDLIVVSTSGRPAVKAQQSLDARVVAGPWHAGETLLVQTDQDELVGYDLRLNRKWAIKIGNVELAGSPEVFSGRILITLANGTLLTVSPSDGSQGEAIKLQQPLAGPPVNIGDQLWLPGSDGTLHLIDRAKF